MLSPSPSTHAAFYSSESLANQKRTGRACDKCRKTKTKCKRGLKPNNACVSCEIAGTDCTYEKPSYKRGPPKGYILAIELRLRQVESLLGTIVSSQDPRAQELIAELKTDELANDIIHRVDSGPFGRTGRRLHHGSSQDAFMAAVSQPEAHRDSRLMREDVSATVWQDHAANPSLEWQDKLLKLLGRRQARYEPQASLIMPIGRKSLGATSSGILDAEAGAAIGQLSLDENDQYRFHDESSGMPMLNRSNSKRLDNRNRGGIWRLPLSRQLSERSETLAADIEEILESKLPPIAEQDFLLELYFTYVHPILPVVHKTSFVAAYEARRSKHKEGRDDYDIHGKQSDRPRCKETISNMLLLSMFAIASRYNEPERKRANLKKGQIWEAGFTYFTSARQVLDAVFRKSSITVCQSVVLLAYREFGMGTLEQAWIYTGIAIRMAQSLGLHRDADKWRRFNVDVFSPVEKEERKLVWWSLFNLEKDISCAMGRPVAITEGNYDTKLPESDSGTFTSEEEEMWAPHRTARLKLPYKVTSGRTISCLRACASLSIIVGRIMEKLYSLRPEVSSRKQSSAYNELQMMLDDWYTDLPNSLTLKHRDYATPHVFTLHMQYWSAVILLRRKLFPLWATLYTDESATMNSDSPPMTALKLCQGAASHVSMIATSMKEWHSPAARCPFFASYLFTSGIVHVANLSMEPPTLRAEVGVAQVMAVLQSMENVWQIASRNWELLNGAKVRIGEAAFANDFRGRQVGRTFVRAVEASEIDSAQWMAYAKSSNIPQSKPIQIAGSSMTNATEAMPGSATLADDTMAGSDGNGVSLPSHGELEYHGITLEPPPVHVPNAVSAIDEYNLQRLLHAVPFSD